MQAYKRDALNEMERHQIAREIWLHVQLNHPAVISLYAAWKDPSFIYMVLEWADEVSKGWPDSITAAGDCEFSYFHNNPLTNILGQLNTSYPKPWRLTS